jgi:hypothetical protein
MEPAQTTSVFVNLVGLGNDATFGIARETMFVYMDSVKTTVVSVIPVSAETDAINFATYNRISGRHSSDVENSMFLSSATSLITRMGLETRVVLVISGSDSGSCTS